MGRAVCRRPAGGKGWKLRLSQCHTLLSVGVSISYFRSGSVKSRLRSPALRNRHRSNKLRAAKSLPPTAAAADMCCCPSPSKMASCSGSPVAHSSSWFGCSRIQNHIPSWHSVK